MRRRHALSFSAVLCSLVALAGAQDSDECGWATWIDGPGQYTFDTTVATTSFPWPCGSGQNDIWYHFTATATTTYALDTCTATTLDTTLEVFVGTCGNLVSIDCDDDTCGLQSEIQFAATLGAGYYIRIGGHGGGVGTGILRISDASAGPGCFYYEPSFLAQCGQITDAEDFSGFAADTNFEVPGGIPIGNTMTLEVLNPLGHLNFVDVPPLLLSNHNGTKHAACYTNKDAPALEVLLSLGGPAQGFSCRVSDDGTIEGVEMAVLSGGVVLDVCSILPTGVDNFVGYHDPSQPIDQVLFRSLNHHWGGVGEAFALDDIQICAGSVGEIGTQPNPCSIPVFNSTGYGADIRAFGSVSVAARNVRLFVESVPQNHIGMFFTSQTIGFLPHPAGSSGYLCVLGTQGRYNSPSQLFSGQGAGVSVPLNGLQIGNVPVPMSPPLAAFPTGTWYFQAWYRDIGGTNNFSDVVQIEFTP